VVKPEREALGLRRFRRAARPRLDLPLRTGLRGRSQTADIEIVEFDRPNRFAFAISRRRQGSGGKEVHFRHTFVLSPEDGATRLERTTDGDGNPVVGFLAKPGIMKDGRTSLGNLKANAESPA
jgi:polyketide cyclase/dehydrase/lipid transport protein